MTQRIYLDNNANTNVDPRILQAILQELNESPGNPSSIHAHGRQAKQRLDHYRTQIAKFLQVKPQEIYFCSGGTEAANLLLYGCDHQGHLLSSNVEHPCVYQTLLDLQKKGAEVTFLPTGQWGTPHAEHVQNAIQPNTKLITLMAANNETGVLADLESIAKIAKKAQIPLIIDGVALLGKEVIAIPDGVSAMFFSAHKIHGPKGIGFIYCRSNLKWTSLLKGGFQEYNHRAGTENLPGIAGLAKAVEIVAQEQSNYIEPMRQSRDQFEKGLLTNLSGILVNGEGPRVSNTSNLSFEGVDGESLLMNLDLAGLSASHGSACSAGSLEPSRILLQMGYPLSRVRTALRFSLSRYTTAEEIEKAVSLITTIVKRLRK